VQTILIASGKGGVGKTTVSIGIARALSKRYSVGLYDADLMCPNGPRLLGMDENARVGVEDERYYPVSFEDLLVFSTGFMLPLDAVMTLEGDRRSALLKDYTSRLEWGDIDYLVVDLPPGTGDENVAVVESMPNIVGLVLVVTGKMESLDDATRVITMLKDLPEDIPIIGVVRNMAYIDCPSCDERIRIFDDAVSVEEELEIPLIGELPYKNLVNEDFEDIAAAIVEFSVLNEYDDGDD
jgi:ATP-binding protein involved in chromosome partitioning